MKKVLDLVSIDLLNKNVWRHWNENGVEYVEPSEAIEVYENSNEVFIVLTEFTLNNKVKYLGFRSPQDGSGLDYIQPVMFTNMGQVELWKDISWTVREKDEALRKIGYNVKDVFPINYKTMIKSDGKFLQGSIVNFNDLIEK